MSGPSPFDDTVQLVEVMPSNDISDGVNTYQNVPAPISAPTSNGGETEIQQPTVIISRKKAYITVGTLLLVNLLNYMDRFTIAGKLSHNS